MEQEEVTLITNDKWLREGGWLDPSDRQVIADASAHGFFKVRFVSLPEMVERMQKEIPTQFGQFKQKMENRHGIPLTAEDLSKFEVLANERLGEFRTVVDPMTMGQATQIRAWRCDSHMTWRSIARAAWREKWFARNWQPPANELMGVALSERAAKLFGEDYMKVPWN
jgi:hypothetical protein